MVEMSRPLPLLTDTNRFFWTSGADGVLRFLRCGGCRGWTHPPQPVCRQCGSSSLEPQAVSGRATVVGWTSNRQPWHPAFPPPYLIAVVSIAEDETVRLTTNLVDVAEDEVAVGMEVEVVFEPADDVWVPLFRPVSS